MRSDSPSAVAALCALIGLSFAPAARAQTGGIVFDGAIVASAGSVAPGTGGGTFATFTHLSLNDAGSLAFVATLSGGTASQGIFLRSGGTTTALALAGQTAPGTGGVFTEFHGVSLNDAGDFAFEALASGAFWPEGSGEGVFRGSGGTVTKVALGGEVAFATTRYARLGISEVALGDGGHVAFLSDVDGGCAPLCGTGVFRDDGSGPQSVVLGGYFESLAVDGAGNVVYAGFIGFGLDGVYRNAGDAVAVYGEAAPGTGGTYDYQSACSSQSLLVFGSVAVNEAGQVAFQAGYSSVPTDGNGLFLDTAGTDAAIAVRGSPAPGGGSFGCMSQTEGGLALNETGTAAFWAQVDGPGGYSGFFLRSGGTTTLVARDGGSPPGMPCIGYAGFAPSTVQLDDAGRVAFVVTQLTIAADTDCDGIPDVLDKCMHDSRNAANWCDSDQDGYGNVCDGDFNQTGTVTAADFAMFFVPALQKGAPTPQGTDMNCSGAVTAADYGMFFVPQISKGTPGRSGLACAGTIPCN